MSLIRGHKDLEVWKKSMAFVTTIYKVTGDFPKEEIYGITNQMRRAAVSIPSNIAEGASRGFDKEFIQFLHFALGSLSELETQILIAENLQYISKIDELIMETEMLRKLLNGLIYSLKNRS
jgi:four helix bundle protein